MPGSLQDLIGKFGYPLVFLCTFLEGETVLLGGIKRFELELFVLVVALGLALWGYRRLRRRRESA